MAPRERAHVGPHPRPGVLLHDALRTPGQSPEYQDHLISVLNYGSKVAGLLVFPAAWVPPYAALPAWLSEEWQADPAKWLRAAEKRGISIVECFRQVSSNGLYEVILRSSAVGEGLEDRGQYRSTKLRGDTRPSEILSAIERIYADLDRRGRHTRMGICVQRYFAPEVAGHVSNEVHLSATRNQWKYEVELPSYAPNRGLNSKFADPPEEGQRLTIKGQRALPAALRRVCNWINVRVDGRSHLEWCVSDNALWLVQLDRENPTSPGENPHLMPPTHFGAAFGAPGGFSCFHRYRIQEETPWKKLNNVRDFWVGRDPPRHRLFFATGQDVLDALARRSGRSNLAREINHLTSSRAVLRTDCRDPRIRSFNLPRTHTVDGGGAVRWLESTIASMCELGASAEAFAFILHQYIPARAAAWSYYSPGDDIVRIDCLWGLPDGLQFLSHDSVEMDARSGEELAAEIRFKRDFLQEQPDGSWEYVRVARQFGRGRVLSKEALRTIAIQTVAVANRVRERAQIMWFCDLPPELGLGAHLPWYRSRDYLIHTQVERPPYRPRQVRTLEDLEELNAEQGHFILVVQPTADLVRADEKFLDQVIALAQTKGAPVELSGSVLGHAYYRLRDAGVLVLTSQPKYSRSRGRMTYRKLVRDAIPANIAAKGERVSFGRLAREEAMTALIGKLFEEGLEVNAAVGPEAKTEELADVLEVLRGMTSIEKLSWEDVEAAADSKRAKRGGFEHQTVLLETARPKPTGGATHGMEAGASEPLVTLHNIGLISVAEGHLTVPFTRLIGAEGLEVEVPFEDGRLLVGLEVTSGGLRLVIQPQQPSDSALAEELDLFDSPDRSEG